VLLLACGYDAAGLAGGPYAMVGEGGVADAIIPSVGSTPVCGSTCEAERSDGCCPDGCTSRSDVDCRPQCGNGVVENGEQCDPRASCPATCPNRGCTQFVLKGSAEACTAMCAESGQQTACKPNDGCCPPGCTGNDDNDCLIVCGNNVKEGSETCDPLSSCPVTCPAAGCQLRKLINPGSCTAQCVNDRQQSLCASGDACCPPGCHSGNDSDCVAVCDNGVKESSESCDPLSSCPTSCPARQCQLRKLVAAGTCQAECVDDRKQTECRSGDGCCPGACHNNNDNDCPPTCGNGVVERGETCEPVAECTRRQTACQSDANTVRTGKGNAGACTFECQQSPRSCGPADGFCPSGCSADPDCGGPKNCVHIEWCRKPNPPNQGNLICRTDDDPRCTPTERRAECARDATAVCGQGHAAIVYIPAIP
jgi:hypothetical protein